MSKSLFETLLSFLLGSSWALLFLGTPVTFQSFSDFGFFSALFSTLLYIFIMLFVILILETLNLYREGHEEKRKQTKLLYDIRELLKKDED
jgi:large-conductance mechanosensitive channel